MEFRILGPLEVAADGGCLRLGGASQRALLALLLLHANEVVSSDRLLDELWARRAAGVRRDRAAGARLAAPQGARAGAGATRDEAARLRAPGRAGTSSTSSASRGSSQEADGAEPAVAAEQLREALALWRGPPLADFAYEPFAQAAIARLEELRLAALERRIDADLALGRHAALVGELEALVARAPAARAPPRPADARALPLGPPGRGARGLPARRGARSSTSSASSRARRCRSSSGRSCGRIRRSTSRRPERSILVAPRSERPLGAAARARRAAGAAPAEGADPRRGSSTTQDAARAGDGRAAGAARRARWREACARARPRFVSADAGATTSSASRPSRTSTSCSSTAPPELLHDPALVELLARRPATSRVVVGDAAHPGAVLVPFVGAEHDWAAVELGAWVAGALDVPLLLAGPRDGADGRDASRLLASASLAVQRARSG